MAPRPELSVFSAPMTVVSYLDVRMNRLPTRRICPDCRHKRVLVTITALAMSWTGASAETVGQSNPRCLDCWGVRS